MKTNNKNVVRLTESQLKVMVTESVREALNEIGDTLRGQYMLGRLADREAHDGQKFPTDADEYAKRQRREINGRDDRAGENGEKSYDPMSIIANPMKYAFDRGYKDHHGKNPHNMYRIPYPENWEKTEREIARKRLESGEFDNTEWGTLYKRHSNGTPKAYESRLYRIVSESIDKVLKNM